MASTTLTFRLIDMELVQIAERNLIITINPQTDWWGSPVHTLVRGACEIAEMPELADNMAGILTVLDPETALARLAELIEQQEAEDEE